MGSGVPFLAVLLSWILGSRPWLFFSRPFWHVFHQTFHSFILASREPSAHLLADSFSCCLVLGFASHVTRLCFSSWSAGCVLRRRLFLPVSSLSRRFLVSTRARHPRSLASSLCGRRPRRVTFALLCARLLFWSVPPPALLCSTLLRRSRWSCASAVVYHNSVC